ncbi:MAG: hypothetical protein AAB426_00250 [Myxococcota bacterium]
MSEHLVQTLLAQRAVTPADIDEVLKRQVLSGGGLDTNLLELDLLDEEALSDALAEAYRLPVARRADIDDIAPHIPRLFPQVFAESYHVVPYRLVGQNFGVLVHGTPDEDLFRRIRERLQLVVTPTMTSEVRAHYAMHRLYGAELMPRMRNLLARLDGVAPKAVLAPTTPSEAPILAWGAEAPTPAVAAPARTSGRRRLHLSALDARLAVAKDRDSLVQVLLEATLAAFDFVSLFAVQGGHINGWRGPDADSTRRIARISVPISSPSVLQTIYATSGHYLGPLPKNSANEALLEGLGRQPPRAALLAPIVVGNKLAAILYADNGSRSIGPARAAAILLIVSRVGQALEALVRQRKAARADPPAQEVVAAPPPGAPSASVALAAPENIAVAITAGDSIVSPSLWESVTVADFDEIDDADIVELEPEDADEEAYVAFNVDESPEQAAQDWEDVLVETVGSAAAEAHADSRSPRVAHVPAVTWDDVIAEARAAPSLADAMSSGRVEVAGTLVDASEMLLDGLDARDPAARQGAIAKLLQLGTSRDDLLRQRFPGTIAFDPFALDAQLPPFAECSGLLALLAARGEDAAAVVMPQVDSDDRQRRFFAIYYLFSVRYAPGLDALARRLFDTEPRNRFLAVEALHRYRQEEGYRRILQSLRDQLKVPVYETQVATVQILGQLREPTAVPALIPLVVSPQRALASAATSALAVICAQAFGSDVARWAEWWQSHYTRPREAWLVEALRHADTAVTRIAHNELVRVTGRAPEPPGTAQQPLRPATLEAWESWWQQRTLRARPPQARSA